MYTRNFPTNGSSIDDSEDYNHSHKRQKTGEASAPGNTTEHNENFDINEFEKLLSFPTCFISFFNQTCRTWLNSNHTDATPTFNDLSSTFIFSSTRNQITSSLSDHRNIILFVPDALKLINPYTKKEMDISDYHNVFLNNGKYYFHGLPVLFLHDREKIVNTHSGQIIPTALDHNFTCRAKTYRDKVYGKTKPKEFLDIIYNAMRLHERGTIAQYSHKPRLG